jgi:hypothetical protein
MVYKLVSIPVQECKLVEGKDYVDFLTRNVRNSGIKRRGKPINIKGATKTPDLDWNKDNLPELISEGCLFQRCLILSKKTVANLFISSLFFSPLLV